jgi:hypothetical protein
MKRILLCDLLLILLLWLILSIILGSSSFGQISYPSTACGPAGCTLPVPSGQPDGKYQTIDEGLPKNWNKDWPGLCWVRKQTKGPGPWQPHGNGQVIRSEGEFDAGMGVLWHKDEAKNYALVWTAHHVIREQGTSISVYFQGERGYQAGVLRVWADWDVALLAIRCPKAPAVPMANYRPAIGSTAWSGGYGGGRWKMVQGRVTEYVRPNVNNSPNDWMVVSPSQNVSGDSGGPIIDEKSRLIGICWGVRDGGARGTVCTRLWSLAQTIITITPNGEEPVSPPKPAETENGDGVVELPPSPGAVLPKTELESEPQENPCPCRIIILVPNLIVPGPETYIPIIPDDSEKEELADPSSTPDPSPSGMQGSQELPGQGRPQEGSGDFERWVADVEEDRNKIATLTSEWERAKREYEATGKQLVRLDSRVQKVESDTSVLQGDVQTIKSALAQQNQELGQLRQEVASLQSVVKDHPTLAKAIGPHLPPIKFNKYDMRQLNEKGQPGKFMGKEDIHLGEGFDFLMYPIKMETNGGHPSSNSK